MEIVPFGDWMKRSIRATEFHVAWPGIAFGSKRIGICFRLSMDQVSGGRG